MAGVPSDGKARLELSLCSPRRERRDIPAFTLIRMTNQTQGKPYGVRLSAVIFGI